MSSLIIVSSYDVFDTLLTRRVCDPKAVFYFAGREAARRGLITLNPEAYRKARVEAESLARTGLPEGEVNFDRIYRVLGRIVGCTDSQLQELMDIELAWEQQLIVPVSGAKEMVEAERQAGRQVHFLSEMYLPGKFLESLLRRHGFMQTGDELWVSHEYQASKRSGKLFSVFLKEARLNANQVEHHGNDWNADYLAPQQMGIRAVHSPQANPTHCEMLLERHSQESNGWTSLMAGAARLVRLQPHADARIAGLWRITADVLCPALTGHVLWILQRAKLLGLRRLYFVSRDGYVQYLMAKHMAAVLIPDLECRYFYGSRQAWHLAGLREADDTALEWILGPCDGMSCASLLKRMDLTWEECEQYAQNIVAAMGKPENGVTDGVRKAMMQALRSDGPFLQAVKGKAEEKRALLEEYANQEGLLSQLPTGMVEVGWSGRTRASLERALAGHNLANLHWFYFGIEHRAQMADTARVHYFLYGPELGRPDIFSLPVVLESFCLALHGSVKGYRREGNKIIPCFREDLEQQLETWGRGYVFAAIEEYLRNFPVECGPFPNTGNLADAVRELLADFCTNPTPEDARIWGAIPFEHDQAAGRSLPLAPVARLSLTNMKNALIFGGVERACMGDSMGAWGAGSWAARPRPLYFLMLAAWGGYLRIHWKNLPKRIVRRLYHLKYLFKNL